MIFSYISYFTILNYIFLVHPIIDVNRFYPAHLIVINRPVVSINRNCERRGGGYTNRLKLLNLYKKYKKNVISLKIYINKYIITTRISLRFAPSLILFKPFSLHNKENKQIVFTVLAKNYVNFKTYRLKFFMKIHILDISTFFYLSRVMTFYSLLENLIRQKQTNIYTNNYVQYDVT